MKRINIIIGKNLKVIIYSNIKFVSHKELTGKWPGLKYILAKMLELKIYVNCYEIVFTYMLANPLITSVQAQAQT